MSLITIHISYSNELLIANAKQIIFSLQSRNRDSSNSLFFVGLNIFNSRNSYLLKGHLAFRHVFQLVMTYFIYIIASFLGN